MCGVAGVGDQGERGERQRTVKPNRFGDEFGVMSTGENQRGYVE
jgi:hypothetical protein